MAKRQTRCVQGAVSIMDVWVQIPPSAPLTALSRSEKFLKRISELRGRCKRLATTDNALVAQRIERCPAEAEAESSNLSKRTIFKVKRGPPGIRRASFMDLVTDWSRF